VRVDSATCVATMGNDMVRAFFPSLADDDLALEDASRSDASRSPRSPRPEHRSVCAAPCQVSEYAPFSTPERSSRRKPWSEDESKAVMSSVYAPASQMMPFESFYLDSSSSPYGGMHVPFKDGSSQLVIRPSLYCSRSPSPQAAEDDPQTKLLGGSYLLSDSYRERDNQFFISDPEDIVDVHVAKYFEAKPHVYLSTRLTRVSPGIYSMQSGRCIDVEWVEASGPNDEGELVVKDGPLRQPFPDFMDLKDSTAEYNSSIYCKNSMQASPQDKSMNLPSPQVSMLSPFGHAARGPSMRLQVGVRSGFPTPPRLVLQGSPVPGTVRMRPLSLAGRY